MLSQIQIVLMYFNNVILENNIVIFIRDGIVGWWFQLNFFFKLFIFATRQKRGVEFRHSSHMSRKAESLERSVLTLGFLTYGSLYLPCYAAEAKKSTLVKFRFISTYILHIPLIRNLVVSGGSMGRTNSNRSKCILIPA